MIPRQGEQCPVVIISYMGYSPPKCTCNDNQTHLSKYMILLECLQDMDENVTHPFPLLEPSLTPPRMPKPNMRKIQFSKQKVFVLENLIPSFGKYIGLPSEANLLDNSPRQFMGSSDVNCWTISQPNSPENLPLKFFSQPFFFLIYFMSRTRTYQSRVPRCIWNALCHFQTIHANIFYMHILTKFNSQHHVIQFLAITSKLAYMC